MPKKGYKTAGTIKTESYLKLEEIAKQQNKTVSETLVFLIEQFSEHLKNCPVYRPKPEGS